MKDTVIVDANLIIRSDWWLDKPQWSVLLGLSSTGQLDLVVPELTIRETIGKFESEVRSQARQLSKLHLEFDAESAVSRYEAHLRSRLDQHDVATPSHDPIALLDLVDRAIQRIAPFDSNGNGFRDSVLWAYVVEFVEDSESVVLLSDDGDFCLGKGDERALNPTLVDEVAGRGNLRWIPNIGIYLDGTGRSEELLEVEAEVLKIVNDDMAAVQQNARVALEEVDIRVDGAGEVSARIVDVRDQIRLRKTAVVDLPQDPTRYVARLTFDATLVVDVERVEVNNVVIDEDVVVRDVPVLIEAYFDSEKKTLDGFASTTLDVATEDLGSAIARKARSVKRSQGQLSDGLTSQALADIIGQQEQLQEQVRQLSESFGPSEAVLESIRKMNEAVAPSERLREQLAEIAGPSKALQEQVRQLSESFGPSEAVLEQVRQLAEIAGPSKALRRAVTRSGVDDELHDEEE